MNETSAAVELKRDVQSFWQSHPCGAKFADEKIGTPEFFQEVEDHRYRLEPHILEMGPFAAASGCRVLELGCGVGTDGAQFSRHGAWYVGADLTRNAVKISRGRLSTSGLQGNFTNLDAENLPFADGSFDFVYSHGVLHHTPDTQAAFDEVHRVLRPGGKAVIMVYYRYSYNYYVNINILRRLGARILRLPGGVQLAHRLTGEDCARLEAHRQLLAERGREYLSVSTFLSQNTDGPGNPLSKVYGRNELRRMLSRFSTVDTAVRFLRRDRIPLLGARLPDSIDRWLGKAVGWHLYAMAQK